MDHIKFKDIAHYYLGTGLLLKYKNFSTNRYLTAFLTGVNNTEIETTYNRKIKGCHGDIISFNGRNNIKDLDLKPLLRSLDSLTKLITVKGYNDDKEFVPSEKLSVHLFDFDFIDMVVNKRNTNGIPFWVVKLLLKWHFNIFNLPETEYIKID